MRTTLWLLATTASLLVASLAVAQTGTVGGAINTHGSTDVDKRNVRICLLPDPQSQTAMQDESVANAGVDCSQTPGIYCTGASCVSSPYCSGSWWNTGEILLRNQAYSLTGQFDKIDYSKIKGNDNVKSNFANPPDHGPCDLIIGLGDNMDSTDQRDYSGLTTAMLHEYEAIKAFWAIIAASGIPYITVRGNHDGEGAFDTLITALGVEGTSFFHTIHSERDQYAIIVPTATGRSICVLGMDFEADEAGNDLTASEITWVGTNVGCGSGLPTIIARHELIVPSNCAIIGSDVPALIADAANDEIFLLVGGHYTSQEFPCKTSTTNASGNSVFKIFTNWQQNNRHEQNLNATGITSSDGAGGMYTVIDLQPGRDRICSHDWNPYWQVSLGESANGQDNNNVLTVSYCAAFDFDTRYGL